MGSSRSYLKKKMFKQVRLSWHVIAYGKLTLAEKGIYAVLKSFYGKFGIIPSIASICERAPCSRRVAMRALASLEEKGVIVRHARTISGKQTSNAYVFHDDLLADKLATSHLAKEASRGAKNAPPLRVPKTHHDIYNYRDSDLTLKEEPENVIPLRKVI